MDVPFISSGAQSRAHYALVRKVEVATSLQQADQHLLAEVKSIRNRIAQPGLSLVGSSSISIISNRPDLFALLEVMQGVPGDYPVLFNGNGFWTSHKQRAGFRTASCSKFS